MPSAAAAGGGKIPTRLHCAVEPSTTHSCSPLKRLKKYLGKTGARGKWSDFGAAAGEKRLRERTDREGAIRAVRFRGQRALKKLIEPHNPEKKVILRLWRRRRRRRKQCLLLPVLRGAVAQLHPRRGIILLPVFGFEQLRHQVAPHRQKLFPAVNHFDVFCNLF